MEQIRKRLAKSEELMLSVPQMGSEYYADKLHAASSGQQIAH